MLDLFSESLKGKKQQTGQWIEKGFTQLGNGEYRQAETSFQQALDTGGEEAVPALEAALKESLKNGHFEAARSIGAALVKRQSDNFELLNCLGNCARRLHDHQQAAHFYQQAISLNASYVAALNNLAASMAGVDLYDEQITAAISKFEIRTDFFLPDYKNNLTLTGKEDFEETSGLLRKAIKENWKSHSIEDGQVILQNDLFNLGLFALAHRRQDIALEQFEKLKKKGSILEDLELVTALANALDSRHVKESIYTLTELQKSDPQSRILAGNLGLLHKQAGDKVQATKYFLICHALLQRYAGFFTIEKLIRTADQKIETKDFKTALKLYRIAVQGSEDPDCWEKLANLLLQLKELPEALKAFNRVLELKPESIQARQNLHVIYTHLERTGKELAGQKKYSQALVIYERALQIERPPDLLEETARIYKMLRRFEDAETLLEESRQARDKQAAAELEKRREHFIIRGKEYSKRKEFTAAIKNLEQAAKIKLDKDVFMHLAHIYKGLKRTRALQDLLNRWHQVTKHSPETGTDGQPRQ